MKYKNLVYTSAIVMATLLTFSVGKAEAQTTANGPYYAWPSWDQQLPASTRFIVLSNWKDTNFPSGGAAVLDRETGLVWERLPNLGSSITWNGALATCYDKKVGNRKGWRLPTLQELASLVDADPTNTSSPRLPPGHPFIFLVSLSEEKNVWSATTRADLTNFAYAVIINGGSITAREKAVSTINFVWCVRGGQGLDAQ